MPARCNNEAVTSNNDRNNQSGRRSGTDGVDDIGELRICRRNSPHQISDKFGILQFQKCTKCRFLRVASCGVGRLEPGQQQMIEFPGAATALPANSRVPRWCGVRTQCRLSASIFLVSAMALAGFSPFGQVCVQFMMVWQRYRRNGSSRSSRRSPVASSRLSTSHR